MSMIHTKYYNDIVKNRGLLYNITMVPLSKFNLTNNNRNTSESLVAIAIMFVRCFKMKG